MATKGFLSPLECRIQVHWQYRVLFTNKAFEPSNKVLANVLRDGTNQQRLKLLVALDQALAAADRGLDKRIERYFAVHSNVAELARAPIVIPGGEKLKNSEHGLNRLLSEIERHHLDRHSFLLAAGGGALLDVAGFAAATAHRGIRHIRLPSTTLSQADSGVGVKNAINAFGKKNFIGAFAPPFAVINDFSLLATLPPRHKRAGYVEAVKVACVRDGRFFQEIERAAPLLRRFNPEAMRQAIYRCAELHVEHIATGGDPFELGSQRPLDFGHWAAHKLEELSQFRLTHAEAVAIGIALDIIYARRSGFLRAESAERILRLLEVLGFELAAPELFRRERDGVFAVLKGLEEFREHLGGRLCITMLRKIGSGFEVHDMNHSRLIESIRELRDRTPIGPVRTNG